MMKLDKYPLCRKEEPIVDADPYSCTMNPRQQLNRLRAEAAAKKSA